MILDPEDQSFTEIFPAYVVLLFRKRGGYPVDAIIRFIEERGDTDWGYRASPRFYDAHGRLDQDGDYTRYIFGVNDPNLAFEVKVRFG